MLKPLPTWSNHLIPYTEWFHYIWPTWHLYSRRWHTSNTKFVIYFKNFRLQLGDPTLRASTRQVNLFCRYSRRANWVRSVNKLNISPTTNYRSRFVGDRDSSPDLNTDFSAELLVSGGRKHQKNTKPRLGSKQLQV